MFLCAIYSCAISLQAFVSSCWLWSPTVALFKYAALKEQKYLLFSAYIYFSFVYALYYFNKKEDNLAPRISIHSYYRYMHTLL